MYPRSLKVGMYNYTKISEEINRAKALHPNYPDDIFQQLAIMQEEAGEVTMAVNEYHSGNGSINDIRTELIQTAAMCMRMLENLQVEQAEHRKNPLLEMRQKAIEAINIAVCYYGCSKGGYCEEPCERRDLLVSKLTPNT